MKKLALLMAILMIVSACFCLPANAQDIEVITVCSSDGLGDLDALNGFESTLQISTGEQICAKLQLLIPSAHILNIYLKVQDEQLGICFPEVDGIWYMLDESLITNLNRNLFSQQLTVPFEDLENIGEQFSIDTITEIAMRYGMIVAGIITSDNVKETQEVRYLESVGEEIACQVTTIAPTAQDWSAMLGKLFATAKEDDDLESLIREVCQIAQAETPLGAVSSKETADELWNGLVSFCDNGLSNLDSISDDLATINLQIAQDDFAVYSVKLEADGDSLEYAGITTADGIRKDALSADGIRILYNEFVLDEGMLAGVLTSEAFGLKINYDLNLGRTSELGMLFGEITASVDDVSASFTVKENGDGRTAHLLLVNAGTSNGEYLVISDKLTEAIDLPEGESVLITTQEEANRYGNALMAKLEEYLYKDFYPETPTAFAAPETPAASAAPETPAASAAPEIPAAPVARTAGSESISEPVSNTQEKTGNRSIRDKLRSEKRLTCDDFNALLLKTILEDTSRSFAFKEAYEGIAIEKIGDYFYVVTDAWSIPVIEIFYFENGTEVNGTSNYDTIGLSFADEGDLGEDGLLMYLDYIESIVCAADSECSSMERAVEILDTLVDALEEEQDSDGMFGEIVIDGLELAMRLDRGKYGTDYYFWCSNA